jgi:hypothetical protein
LKEGRNDARAAHYNITQVTPIYDFRVFVPAFSILLTVELYGEDITLVVLCPKDVKIAGGRRKKLVDPGKVVRRVVCTTLLLDKLYGITGKVKCQGTSRLRLLPVSGVVAAVTARPCTRSGVKRTSVFPFGDVQPKRSPLVGLPVCFAALFIYTNLAPFCDLHKLLNNLIINDLQNHRR